MRTKIIGSIALSLIVLACQSTTNGVEKHEYHRNESSNFRLFSVPKNAEGSIIYDSYYEPLNSKVRPNITIEVKPVPVVKSSYKRGDPKAYALSKVGAKQFSCLDQLWTKESHWNYKAYNSNSGAYGIPQALPGSKMAWAGSDWKTNPITQVKWGLHYINGRYGSACGAWSFWRSHHWY